jgi:hypothetical protein
MARSIIALHIEFTCFILWCLVINPFVSGSIVTPEVRLNFQKADSSQSPTAESRDTDADQKISFPVGGARVGSGFKILKSPSASGLHKLCGHIEENPSSTVADIYESHQETDAEEKFETSRADSAAKFEFPRKRVEDLGLREATGSKRLDATDTHTACIPTELFRPLLQVRFPRYETLAMLPHCGEFAYVLTRPLAAVDLRCAPLGRRGAHHLRGGRPRSARR